MRFRGRLSAISRWGGPRGAAPRGKERAARPDDRPLKAHGGVLACNAGIFFSRAHHSRMFELGHRRHPASIRSRPSPLATQHQHTHHKMCSLRKAWVGARRAPRERAGLPLHTGAAAACAPHARRRASTAQGRNLPPRPRVGKTPAAGPRRAPTHIPPAPPPRAAPPAGEAPAGRRPNTAPRPP